MRIRKHWLLLTGIILAMLLAGCAAPVGGGGQAATVNSKPISQADYDKQIQLTQDAMKAQGLDLNSEEGKATLDQLRTDILDQMIENELMRQAAESEGIKVTEADITSRVEEIKTQVGGAEVFNTSLKQANLSETDFRNLVVRDQLVYERLYDKLMKDVPTTAEQVHSRHILVATEQEAKDIQARLAKGEDFAALAKQLSLDTGSNESGGDLGFYPRGVLDSAFEDVIFKLQPSQTSIVQTDFGYHVVQVLERDPNRALATEVLQQLGEEKLNTYMDGLRSKAKIDRLVKLPPTATPSQ